MMTNLQTTLRGLLFEFLILLMEHCCKRVSKAKVNDYSEKFEVVAAKLAPPMFQSNKQESHEFVRDESPSNIEGSPSHPFGLRRRLSLKSKNTASDKIESDQSMLVKLDSAAQGHIDRHRLQANLKQPIRLRSQSSLIC